MAGRESDAGAGACAKTESDLLAHLLDTRPSPGRDALGEHIAACQGCRDTLERLEAAELAFARPDATALPPGVAEQIVTAIVIAAPVRVDGENVAWVRRKTLRLLAGEPADTAVAPALAPAEAAEPLSPAALVALSAGAAAPAGGSDLTSVPGESSAAGTPAAAKDDSGSGDRSGAAAGTGVVAAGALDAPASTSAGTAAETSLRERFESRAAERPARARGRRRRFALAGVFAVFVAGAGTALAMNLTSSDEPTTSANVPFVNDSTTALADDGDPDAHHPAADQTTADAAAERAARARERREKAADG